MTPRRAQWRCACGKAIPFRNWKAHRRHVEGTVSRDYDDACEMQKAVERIEALERIAARVRAGEGRVVFVPAMPGDRELFAAGGAA